MKGDIYMDIGSEVQSLVYIIYNSLVTKCYMAKNGNIWMSNERLVSPMPFSFALIHSFRLDVVAYSVYNECHCGKASTTRSLGDVTSVRKDVKKMMAHPQQHFCARCNLFTVPKIYSPQ